MELAAEKNQWVHRVLGIEVAEKSALSHASDIPDTWNAAKEAVDARLGQLAAELRSYEDEQLDRVAEFGLFGLTQGGETVALTRALMTYGGSQPAQRQRSADGLRAAISAYRSAVLESRVVELIDGNPLGVDVALATTLGGALHRIEQSIG